MIGSNRHRLAVAEDEVHIAVVEFDSVIVSDVAVHHIPTRSECCGAAACEHGIVGASVHFAVSIDVVDWNHPPRSKGG